MRYLSAPDIAAAVERDVRTVRRWVAAGRLPRPIAGLGGERARWDAAEVAAALTRGGYAVPAGWETGTTGAAA